MSAILRVVVAVSVFYILAGAPSTVERRAVRAERFALAIIARAAARRQVTRTGA